MAAKSAIRAEGARLLALFAEAGATPVECDILLPAERLLDLYGEDIRARAYVTSDPIEGEIMLRPDFTLPVAQRHLAEAPGEARYAYMGEVFRRQDRPEPGRPSEYLQVGYEVMEAADPAAAEAEVFALIAGALAPLGLRAAIGDMGLLTAAVGGLATTPARRAALMRHIWRPRRFRALLERFGGRDPQAESRRALLARLAARPAAELIAEAGPALGLRSPAEVADRLEALAAEAATPPIVPGDIALIDDLLGLRAAPADALARLRDMAVDLPAIEPAVDRLEARLAAMAARGVATERLDFEGSFGRTTLEYYDGFVFGLFAATRPDLPPVAQGGRYDALMRALGRDCPAVGGMIRPGLVVQLGEGGR